MGSIIAFFLGVGQFFKAIPMKVWIAVILAAAILFLVWRMVDTISDHFEYVEGLEKSKTELTTERDNLKQTVSTLEAVNRQNKEVYDKDLRQRENARRIADEARADAERRAQRYRSIIDELNDIPQEDRQSIDPVIRGVIDRLWDPAEGTAADNRGS